MCQFGFFFSFVYLKQQPKFIFSEAFMYTHAFKLGHGEVKVSEMFQQDY